MNYAQQASVVSRAAIAADMSTDGPPSADSIFREFAAAHLADLVEKYPLNAPSDVQLTQSLISKVKTVKYFLLGEPPVDLEDGTLYDLSLSLSLFLSLCQSFCVCMCVLGFI